jgi:hypothetical protein
MHDAAQALGLDPGFALGDVIGEEFVLPAITAKQGNASTITGRSK